MNDETKDTAGKEAQRRAIGVLASSLMKRIGITTKARGAAGTVATLAVVAGTYVGIDFLLDETLPIPEPTPIVEPIAPPPVIVNVNVGENETSTPPLIEEPEASQQIPNGQSQPPAPSSNETSTSPLIVDAPEQVTTQTAGDAPVPAPTSPTEELEWTPTPTPKPRESTSQPSQSETEKSTTEVIPPASSPVASSTSEPETAPTPEPQPTLSPTLTPVPPVPKPAPTTTGESSTQTPLPEPSPTAIPEPTASRQPYRRLHRTITVAPRRRPRGPGCSATPTATSYTPNAYHRLRPRQPRLYPRQRP